MTKPDVFSGVMCGIIVFLILFIVVILILEIRSKSGDSKGKTNSGDSIGKKNSIGCSTTLIIVLIISIAAGVFYAIKNPVYVPPATEKDREVKHKCAICGKTEGTTQINNNKIGGKWDDNWYCPKHYADAWQYYYGDNNN